MVRVTLLLPLPTDPSRGTRQRASSAYFSSGQGCFLLRLHPHRSRLPTLVRKEFSLLLTTTTITLGSPLQLRCNIRYDIRSRLLNSPPSHRWRLLSPGKASV